MAASLSYCRFVGRCGIKGCRLDPCPLSAHRSYMRRRNIANLGLANQNQDFISLEPDDLPVLDPRLLPTSHLVEQSVQYIDRHFGDGLPPLPFETTHVNEFRGLMYHYLDNQVHRLSRIFSPHVDPDARIRSLLETIYSNPVFSVCVIGNSQTDRVMLARNFTPDRTSQAVYGLVLRVLRERIESFQPNDVPWLLLLVIALAGLEFCSNSPGDMQAHRAAMAKLIGMQGGIQAIGFIYSYVVNTDRFIALCLGEYPLYGDIVEHQVKPAQPVGRYGGAFQNLVGVVDQLVIEFSENQCRLIDMLEKGGVDLADMSGDAVLTSMGSNVLPHFLSLRDKICQDHANLHAYYHENRFNSANPSSLSRASSISRCVVLGGHIVFYLLAFADYYTIMRPMLASELASILRLKPRHEWAGNEDIIIWLMFVLATVPQWDGHNYAVAELRLWLSHKYQGSLPNSGWIAKELQTLRGYVWSDSKYTQTYHAICAEVLALEERAQRSSEGSSDGDRTS